MNIKELIPGKHVVELESPYKNCRYYGYVLENDLLLCFFEEDNTTYYDSYDTLSDKTGEILAVYTALPKSGCFSPTGTDYLNLVWEKPKPLLLSEVDDIPTEIGSQFVVVWEHKSKIWSHTCRVASEEGLLQIYQAYTDSWEHFDGIPPRIKNYKILTITK